MLHGLEVTLVSKKHYQMLHHLSKMENGQNVNAPKIQGSFLLKPLDQRERTKSNSDIMNRRLKNRERQRRYRARKRLEADTKKAGVINPSTPLQVELPLNGSLTHCMTRIHCKRDWKKDARRAQISKQAVTSNGLVIPARMSASESQATCFPYAMQAEPPLPPPPPPLESEIHSDKPSSLDNLERDRITLGRRSWKSEARNKKN
ncbi:hypothetical protein L1049_022010 [Liquidambar formosana]|uniref:BZIP domain-containing protein n=1 Tax=Liquidambar formosana TaxID=63359 RepID=A0AAP0RBW3_LIQFO